MTFRLPDAKHERLRRLAEQRGVSINKLFEELVDTALAQHDVEARFRAIAVRDNAQRGLAILDKLDRAFARKIR